MALVLHKFPKNLWTCRLKALHVEREEATEVMGWSHWASTELFVELHVRFSFFFSCWFKGKWNSLHITSFWIFSKDQAKFNLWVLEKVVRKLQFKKFLCTCQAFRLLDANPPKRFGFVHREPDKWFPSGWPLCSWEKQTPNKKCRCGLRPAQSEGTGSEQWACPAPGATGTFFCLERSLETP